jgi:hypothetical protein
VLQLTLMVVLAPMAELVLVIVQFLALVLFV